MGYAARVAHVILRAKERYGLVLTPRDIDIIQLWIRKGYKTEPSEYPARVQTQNYRVLWSNIWITVNVCLIRGWVNTILPASCNKSSGFKLRDAVKVRGKKWRDV